MDELYRFLSKNLKTKGKGKGKVLVTFVVGKDGSISEIEVLETISAAASDEAVRLVKLMPNWIPGTQNDRPVSVRFVLPIVFR